MPGPFFKKHLQFNPKKNSKPFREAVKAILSSRILNSLRTAKNALVGEYIDAVQIYKACETLDNGFEDAFHQYTVIGNGPQSAKKHQPS